ncbi:MAG: PAS domain-containing protein [Alphaproteobacteria bacterium]|nr:PAS domain-containing protein [Alphaproteobacteria bacterium]
MTRPAFPPPDDDRRDLFPAFARQRRATDFAVLVAAALSVMAACVLLGDMSVWAGLVAAAALSAFAFLYFAGAASLEQDAIRSAREAAGEEARQLRIASERAFRAAMIDALAEPAMYIDAQGKVEAANAAARRQFRFLGAGPLLTVVVRRPEVIDAVTSARRDGEAQFFEFVERDETDRYFSCVAAPLVTETSSGVLVSMHDLTEIKRAGFARVDFLANASHELRTPLTSLSGFIETLRGPARDDPAARDRFLEIMQGQADRMRRLIQDLLSLSRIELSEHRPPDTEADLASVVAEVGDALQPVAAERGVKLRISGLASGVLVIGVRDELAQVAQNLIDNAIKYSEAGDVVEIEVLSGLPLQEAATRAGRRWAEAGHMSIATVSGPANGDSDGRYAVLRVTDSGPGIDRQHLPRLAERFYRVDPGRGLRKGTGLGLAIVKHVVARHRGEFLVESEPGRGSAFGVILPAAARKGQGAARSGDAGAGQAG